MRISIKTLLERPNGKRANVQDPIQILIIVVTISNIMQISVLGGGVDIVSNLRP